MVRLPAEVADSAGVVLVVAAASAAVNRPRPTGHLPVVAAGHRPRTARLPAVAVAAAAAAAAASAAVLAVEPLLRATERLLRLIAHPLQAMGHRRAVAVAVAAAAAVAVVDLPLAMERPVPAATVVAVDIPVAAERRPLLTVHLREVAADIPAVAEDRQRLMVPHPVVAVSEAALAVTLEAAEAADRRRLTVRRALAAAVAAEADRVMPVMEDTNTNPDTCSPGEMISVLNRVGFRQVSRIGRQESSVRLIRVSENGRRSPVTERPILIKR